MGTPRSMRHSCKTYTRYQIKKKKKSLQQCHPHGLPLTAPVKLYTEEAYNNFRKQHASMHLSVQAKYVPLLCRGRSTACLVASTTPATRTLLPPQSLTRCSLLDKSLAPQHPRSLRHRKEIPILIDITSAEFHYCTDINRPVYFLLRGANT